MARPQAEMKLGYYPQPEGMSAAVGSLFRPNPLARTADLTAGDGAALLEFCEATSTSGIANEIEKYKFQTCQSKFRIAAEGDFFTLKASRGFCQTMILNPPYALDGQATGANKRREYQYFKHAFDAGWIQQDGHMIAVLYTIHVNHNFLTLMANNCSEIDLWGWDGTVNGGEYKHVVIIGKLGKYDGDKTAWVKELKALADAGQYMSLQQTPIPGKYIIPNPSQSLDKITFKQEMINVETQIRAVQDNGGDMSQAFQLWSQPNSGVTVENPVISLKMNHALTMVEAAVLEELLLPNPDGTVCCLRAVVSPYTTPPQVVDPKAETPKWKVITSMRSVLFVTHDNGDVQKIDESSIADFMRDHGTQILEETRKNYPPLFDVSQPFEESPAKQQWLPKIDQFLVKGQFEMYDVQKTVANGALNYLVNGKKKGMYLALDPRVGKTPISISMMGSLIAARLAGEVGDYDLRKGDVFIVQCPGDLMDKWRREIIGMIPSANVMMVSLEDMQGDKHDILADIRVYMDACKDSPIGQLNVIIVHQDSIKLGEIPAAPAYLNSPNPRFDKEAAEVADRDPLIYHDPVSGLPVYMEDVEKDGKAFAYGWLYKGSYVPHDNQRGGEWTHIDRENKSYPVFTQARRYRLPKKGNGRIDGELPGGLVTGEYPMDSWIAKKGVRCSKNPRMQLHVFLRAMFPNRIAWFFVDELHHAGSEGTDINTSTVALAQLARKTIGLTGTVTRGVSTGIYDLERVIAPAELFKHYPYGPEGRRRWIDDMGFYEQFLKEKDEEDEEVERGITTGVIRPDGKGTERPGTTPLLVKWILGHAIFVALRDLGAPLVGYEHINQSMGFIDEQKAVFAEAESMISEGEDLKYINKLMKFNFLFQLTNNPFLPLDIYGYEIFHNDNGKEIGRQRHDYGIVCPLEPEVILPKELALMQYIHRAMEDGVGVCIYVQQTGERDIQDRLKEMIEKWCPEAKPFILRTTVNKVVREKYINDHTAKGFKVMICNPTLVQEGYDLVQFPRYWWHEHTTNSIVVIQASARGWGIPQTRDCEIMFPVYEDSVEEAIVARVALKIKAHEVLKGDEVGLSSVNADTGDVLADILKNMDKGAKFDLNAMFADINAINKDKKRKVVMTPVVISKQAESSPVIITEEPKVTMESLVAEAKELGGVIAEKPYCPSFRSPFKSSAYKYLRKADKLPLPEDLDGIMVEDMVVRVKLFGLEGSTSVLVTGYNSESGEVVGFRTRIGSFEPFSMHVDEIMKYRSPMGLPAERDLRFSSCSLADAFQYERNEAGLKWLAEYNIYPTNHDDVQNIVQQVIDVSKPEPMAKLAEVWTSLPELAAPAPVEVAPLAIEAPAYPCREMDWKLRSAKWSEDFVTYGKKFILLDDGGKKLIVDDQRAIVWYHSPTEHRRLSVVKGQPVYEVVFAA